MELTAAGLFRIFTGFPFNHLPKRLREPMQGKGTKSIAGNQEDVLSSTDRTMIIIFFYKQLKIGYYRIKTYFWIIRFVSAYLLFLP